jgi:inward rectifier potassium channel
VVEAEFRLLFMRSELTKEGEEVRRFYPLRLQFDHLINFPAALTLRHLIDETSPLFGLTPEDLKLADSRMLASIRWKRDRSAIQLDCGCWPHIRIVV